MVNLCNTLGLYKKLLVGNEFYQTNCEQSNKFKATAEAAEFLKQQDYKNHAFFIKGSRGMKLETLVDFIL
jgi:UDP-N-acetylmuramyl pentapeptide synthase